MKAKKQVKMPQKICVISFDHWNYDEHIVTALQDLGIESYHIKIGNFKYKNLGERILNSLSKIFLGKNPKLKKRQDYIIETLEKRGKQDQILVINPELIDEQYHKKIKTYTDKYIAYLYDSVSRCPVQHLLDGYFDEIYSFDKDDILKYGFKQTTNYNYLSHYTKPKNFSPAFEVLYVASFDKRMEHLRKIALALDKIKVSYKFIIVGKKTTLFKLKNLFTNKYSFIELRRKRISQSELIELYKKSNVVLDLVREQQTGLSFRVFEAMATDNKLITNNNTVKNYDFYNPKNILIINSDCENLDVNFFKSNYETISQDIYNYYTIDNWVKNIFNIK